MMPNITYAGKIRNTGAQVVNAPALEQTKGKGIARKGKRD